MTRPTDPRRGRSHPVASVSYVLALAGVLLLAACGRGGPGGTGGPGAMRGEAGDKAPDPIPVEVAKIGRRAIAASYSGTAPLEARAESQVVAKTSGVALEVLAKVGDRVRAGQTLVRLDSARAQLQAAQSQAQMRKLESNYQRSLTLAKQQLISANDIDQLKFDLANARAANRLANLELSYANVKAPISGVVAQVSIKAGNFVQINTPILRIVDIDKLEATLNVPERELETMKPGLPVALKVDALPGKTFTGTVDRVAPVVDSGSGTFRVICAFDSGQQLQPGMFGRIRIDYDQRANALAMPRAALLEDQGKPAVYAVRDGNAARAAVTTGYVEGEWVEIRGGLKEGDAVIVAGKSAVREGSPVQVIDADANANADTAAPARTAASDAGKSATPAQTGQ